MNSATSSLTGAVDGFVAFLPRLVAGLLILLIGYIAGLLLARATRALLGRVGYDRLLAKLGVLEENRVETRSGSSWTASAVFWLILLVAVMQAARTWNLAMVGVGVGRVLAYVPHILGAALIFAAALYSGAWVRDRIAQREVTREGSGRRPLVASSVRAGILALGAFMALRELQIAPEIVTIAFGVTVTSIGLAAALAFGLGSRGVAARVTEDWYEKRPRWDGGSGSRRVAPPLERPRGSAPP